MTFRNLNAEKKENLRRKCAIAKQQKWPQSGVTDPETAFLCPHSGVLAFLKKCLENHYFVWECSAVNYFRFFL